MTEELQRPGRKSLRLAATLYQYCWFVLLGLMLAWCAFAMYALDDYFPSWATAVSAGLILVGLPILWFRYRPMKWKAMGVLALLASVLLIVYASLRPSHDRDWGDAQAVMPTAVVGNDRVLVQGIRSFRYSEGRVQKNYFDLPVELKNVKRVWFGVDRFSSAAALAHTFLSFEIRHPEQTRYLAFSIETRREKNEPMYSPLRGCFCNYETIYVIADEQDVLSLRSDVRQHEVQLYPLRATPQQSREIFVDMLHRVNELAGQPEFYHTLTNNCTNNLVMHANKVLELPINPASQCVVFPGYSDWLVHHYGMLDTELELDRARQEFRVDQKAAAYQGQSDFSNFIRQ